MQVIAKQRLQDSWSKHPRSKLPLRARYAIACKAAWTGPADVKVVFGKGLDFVGDNRIIFDIRNDAFRLIVPVAYPFGRILIKFIGTHAEYDRIDPETV